MQKVNEKYVKPPNLKLLIAENVFYKCSLLYSKKCEIQDFTLYIV